LVGVGAIAQMGTDGAYVVHLVTALAALAILAVFVRQGEVAEGSHDGGHANLVGVLRANGGVFLTAGVGVVAIQVLRAARQVVLPLWAVHIGLDASEVSLIFGISVGMEMLLFYPAGSVMDRMGRKWVALPCLGIMSVGMLLIPVSQGFLGLALVGIFVGFGNGLGSGIVMTLGADFSPARGRAQFLGAWRFVGDLGTAGGPLVVAGATAVAGLAAASLLMGTLGVAGAAMIAFRMPEPLKGGGWRRR
ncbi:MAG TPA: MFS transporter, partial [Tepidiformaceae bacterium]|nr:MFS transporter [Tepidiformaceae bacterium]